jgi:hypothetical protein
MSTSGNIEWGRECQLVVGSGGSGVDFSKLRIAFEVVKTIEKQPNTATIKVYNMSDANVSAIEDVYTDVLLKVGYHHASSLIFVGTIQFVSHYRDSTDYITELTCGDGDRDYRNAHINVTLAAGTTDEDAVDQICAVMGNTRKGTIQVTSAARLRGKVLHGQARDALTEIARTNGCNWSIQDGDLQMVRNDTLLGANTAEVVNAATGMLSAPERNDKGIGVTILLNPKIAINAAIKLNNEEIKLKHHKTKSLGKTKTKKPPVGLNADGIYKVIKLAHFGDTRGPDWRTEITCIGLGQPIPTSGTSSGDAGIPVEGMESGI